MRNTLLVVAKQPLPGQTKTRLCPPLTGAQAAELYECFLRDTLAIMRQVPDVHRVIAYQAENGPQYFQSLAPDMQLTPQCGASLGERLDHLLTEALAAPAGKAVVMDSDSPTLPAAYVVQAFAELEQADVVLGPTEDGGYYLIGMKQPHPRLLREVRMSTANVLNDTLVLAEQEQLRVALLPTWFDVDVAGDLDRLRADSKSEVEGVFPTQAAALAPSVDVGAHSRAWLRANGWEE